MSVKMSLWTLLLFLLPFVSSENAGECKKPFLERNVVLSSSALLKNNFPHESEVTLKCALGYEVDQGSNTIVCLNGEWSKQELTCKKRDCGEPKSSPNMQYHTPEGTLFGALIKPVCDRGYVLQGSSYRQCLAAGWGGKSQCHLVICKKFPEIPHSIVVTKPNKEILEFKDVVEFSCEDNYTLIGNRSVVCQENGNYSSLPQCKGECQKPVLEGNVVLSSSALLKNNFSDASEVTLKCAHGYQVDQGSDTIVCLNGEWSKQELTCKMVTCGKCPEIPHSVIVSHLNKEILEFEDVVEFSCKDNYSLVGNGSVVCQEDGNYSSLPQCKEREGEEKDVSAYRIFSDTPLALMIVCATLILFVLVFPCICILIQFYKNRNGSYDTGERPRTKESLIQENIFNYIQ